MTTLIIATLALCLVTATVAARKGYNYLVWLFGGSIVGLGIVSFLPNLATGKLPENERASRRKKGNMIGAVLAVLSIGGVVAALYSGALYSAPAQPEAPSNPYEAAYYVWYSLIAIILAWGVYDSFVRPVE